MSFDHGRFIRSCVDVVVLFSTADINMDILEFVLILLAIGLAGYGLYSTHVNMISVSSEMKQMQSHVTSEIKTLSSSVGQEVSSVSSAVKSEIGTMEEDVNKRLTTMNSTLQSSVSALATNDGKLDAKIATLSSYGKVAEVGQVAIKAVNTASGIGGRTDTATVLFTKTYKDPPQVILSPIQVMADNRQIIRYGVVANNITKTGFNLTLTTWENAAMVSAVVQFATVVY